MDSIVEKSGAVFPFQDPTPVHFDSSKAELLLLDSYEYINNPYTNGSYLAVSTGQVVSYYDESDNLIWTINFYQQHTINLVQSAVFFYQENGENFVLLAGRQGSSYARVVKVKLSDATVTLGASLGSETYISSFIAKNDDVYVSYGTSSSHLISLIDKNTASATGDIIQPIFPRVNALFLDNRVRLVKLQPSSISSGTAGGYWGEGIVLSVDIALGNSIISRDFRFPFYSANVPFVYLQGSAFPCRQISKNTLAMLSRDANPESTQKYGDGQKYWDLASFETWLSNVIEFYTGYKL